ncbi:MAG: hypothetical protein IKH80_07165 [Bacteroidaceae bacterium]|nr:hypothetical protein [Bacteroidaceae bacterium]
MEDKINMEGLFKGANLNGAQIIAVNTGEVYYQKYGEGTPTISKTEEDVKQAIVKLMEARDERNEYLIRDQDQWYAIFRVLSTFCGYPQKPSDFSKTMENLGMGEVRIPCKYDSFRKVSPNQLPQNVSLWHQYENTADQYSKKQVIVAIKLMDLLEIDRR